MSRRLWLTISAAVAALLLIPATAEPVAAGAVGTWHSLGASEPPPTHRSSAVHDPVRQRMIVFGGDLADDVWMLELAGQPAWKVVRVPNGPPARQSGTAVYDALRDRVVLFGGWDASGYPTDLWALDLAGSPAWREVIPFGPRPPAKPNVPTAGIYDPVRDRILLARGGTDYVPGFDLWALPLEPASRWVAMQPSGTPPTGVGGAAYDPVLDRMLVTSRGLDRAWSLPLSGTPYWGEVSPAAGPGATQWEYSTVFDSARRRLVLFGGYGTGSYLNETWELSLLTAPAWSEAATIGSTPAGRFEHSAILDGPGDRMIVFGGYAGAGVLFQDLWALDLASFNSWSRLHTIPDRRRDHAAIYDPVGDRMVVYGGMTIAGPYDLWELPRGSVSTSARPLAAGGPAPSRRSAAGVAYDPVRERLLVFGGIGGPRNNELWALSLTGTPAWQALAPAGTPPAARAWHSVVYDPVRDRLVMFGGSTGVRQNDAWELSLAGTPAWTPLAPAGTPPAARLAHRAVYDPVRDRMLVIGGLGSSALNDVWALSFAGGGAWQPIVPAGTAPDPRYDLSAVYDPIGDRVIVYGGRGARFFSDAHALELSPSPRWVPLPAGGDLPGARANHSAVYDPRRDRMVVFGGLPLGATNDLHALSWQREATVGVPGPSPTGFGLGGLRPNPARRGEARVELTLPDSRAARLELFDLGGRRVWSEQVGDRGPGTHLVRVAGGRQLAPGLYLARLTRDGRSLTARGVILE